MAWMCTVCGRLKSDYRYRSETTCVAMLMKLYQALTAQKE